MDDRDEDSSPLIRHPKHNNSNMNTSSIDDDLKLEFKASSDFNGLETNRSKLHLSKWNVNSKIYENDEQSVDSNSDWNPSNNFHHHQNIVVERSPKGRYGRFEEEIGKGQFKRVYKAYDFDEGKEVAWNVIDTLERDNEHLERIYEEIKLLKTIDHEYIISYLISWYNQKKNQVILISELFTGGSLFNYIQKIKYPRLKVIKNWAKNILKGLKYLHEFSPPIIHRDIKCDNIFINVNDGRIKIGDLGLSCEINNKQSHSYEGTPEFMAPEIFTGEYGVKVDIYSFGMCLLEMITLEKPYKEYTGAMEIFNKIRTNVLPNSLYAIRNQNVLDFIHWCLEYDETKRPSAEDLLQSNFINDLESEENNHPVTIDTKEFKDYINLVNSSSNNYIDDSNSPIKSPRNKKRKGSKIIQMHNSSSALKNITTDYTNIISILYDEMKNVAELKFKKTSSYCLPSIYSVINDGNFFENFRPEKFIRLASRDKGIRSKSTSSLNPTFPKKLSNHIKVSHRHQKSCSNQYPNIMIEPPKLKKEHSNNIATKSSSNTLHDHGFNHQHHRHSKYDVYDSESSQEESPFNFASKNQEAINFNDLSLKDSNNDTQIVLANTKEKEKKRANIKFDLKVLNEDPNLPNHSKEFIEIALNIENYGKSKMFNIKFFFNIKTDTCEGIVTELGSAIDLSKENILELTNLLRKLVSKYRHSQRGSVTILEEKNNVVYYSSNKAVAHKKEAVKKENENHKYFIDVREELSEYDDFVEKGKSLYERLKLKAESSLKKGQTECFNTLLRKMERLKEFLDSENLH